MTRKDYVKIADALKDAKQSIEKDPKATTDQWMDALVERITDVFYEDNPRFNYHKFIGYLERR